MGRFLNKGNEKFERFSRSKYYVDKTELINKLHYPVRELEPQQVYEQGN